MQGLITYSGHTLTLPRITLIGITFEQEGNDNWSSARVHEGIVFEEWMEIKVAVKNLLRAQYNAFYAWWAYARQKENFSFAVDENKTANTTLDDAAAAGQKTIPLTTTADFTAGDYALIKQASGDDFEIVEIASIDAGVSVTAEDNLKYSYIFDDIFRHQLYWPDVILKENSLDMPIQDRPRFDLSWTMIEQI